MAAFPNLDFNHINELNLIDSPILDFNIESQGIKLNCRLNRQIQSDYLIVVPNGIVDRKQAVIPAFNRWNWLGVFKCTVLAISDPTLYLDSNINNGWFLGSKYLDVTSFVADTVVKISNLLGIDSKHIIFWNSGDGGYASILLSSYINGASFVSINSPTMISNCNPVHIETLTRIFDETSSAEDLFKLYPNKFSVINALQSSYEDSKITKGVIVQNTIDEKRYHKHYIPFCRSFDIPYSGGVNQSLGLHSLIYKNEKIRGPEPINLANSIFENYLPLLLK